MIEIVLSLHSQTITFMDKFKTKTVMKMLEDDGWYIDRQTERKPSAIQAFNEKRNCNDKRKTE